VSACGGSSGEGETATTGSGGESVDVSEQTTSTAAGSVQQAPVENDLASVPLLEPALEIEIGTTDEPKSIALSPDGSLVAVLGGGPFRDIDAFLKVYDTTTGDLTNDVSLDEESGSVGRLYWTADNHLIGLDTVSFETRVVTWDGTTFELIDSFVMEEFVCLDAIFGFDPVAGAIFAYSDMERPATLCRRELTSDTVFEIPLKEGQELESRTLLADGSALVAEVWDEDAQQYLLVRFDPTTLEVTDSEVLDPDRLEAAGVGVELIMASDNGETGQRALSLQPGGVAVPSGLNRPRFSPDGSLLWAVRDETELLIDVSTGEPLGRFELGRGHLYWAWSADGSILVNPTLGTTLQVFRP
jgi:WD40 repeat protein